MTGRKKGSIMRGRIVQGQNKIKDYMFVGILALGVVLLRIFYITRAAGPFIYADEFGYWSHAAHMTGHIWAGAMDGVAWYSFGYSFWLALTFLFSNNMVVMYRIAVLLNVLMSVGIYVIAYVIVRKLMKEQQPLICGAIAFAATCFPTYIFYSYTTMSETLLALLIWLLFYELMSLEERPKCWKSILLGVTAGYAYMVHNRSLTALMAVGVCVAALWLMRRIDWKMLLSFIIPVLVMFLVFAFIKDGLEKIVIDSQTAAQMQVTIGGGTSNTFGSIWGKFLAFFTPEKISRPFLSLFGQLWQCLSATYLLLGVGIVYVIWAFKRNLPERQNLCQYAYPFLAVLFSFGLTSVAMTGPDPGMTGRVRIDTAFYGRYNECYYPLLIMMALILLCKEELRGVLKICLGVAVLYLALSVGMFFRMRGLEDGYLNIVSAVGIHIFHWLGEFSVWKCSVIALTGGAVIIGLCHFRRIGRIGCYAGMLALVFLFSTTALYCMRTSIRGENDHTMQYAPMYDYLNENTKKDEVVYICETEKAAYDLQSRLVDQAVVSVQTERVAEIGKDAYVVLRKEQLEEISAIYEVCMECEEFLVLKCQ